MLNLYNTLSKKLEEIPKKDRLNLYTCGPTVYNYAHIGNMRSYILADLLYRTLKFEGYNPKWVMNITDIDDKTIKGTVEKFGKEATVDNLREFTNFYYQEFLKDLKEVNVLSGEITFIKVTDVIPQIQEFIVGLMQKGYAYKEGDGVYFNIDKYQKDFGDYGELVGSKFLEGKKTGARVKVDEYDKENLSDFALWKAHSPEDANIFWDHPELGKGRPGWHIECSAINQFAFKNQPTDIHTGGVDLIFPHHTNEIAQSQGLLGKRTFVKHWFHSEHLLVDGKKMAKSAKNFYTLADIKQKGFSGMDFRYMLLSSGYRNQQNFTWENLLASHQALSKAGTLAPALPDSIIDALSTDLNFAEALGIIWKEKSGGEIVEQVFGLGKMAAADEVPSEVQELIAARQDAKEKKDFKKSDEIRKQIEDLGYELMDTGEGQKVKKKIRL